MVLQVNRTRPVLITKQEEVNGDKLWSVFSTLYFHIPDFLPLKLKCRAELYSVYNESSAVIIQPKPRLSINPASNVFAKRSNITAMSVPALPVSTIGHHSSRSTILWSSRVLPTLSTLLCHTLFLRL